MARAKNIFLAEDDEDDQLLFAMAVKEIDNSICLNQAKNGVEALTTLDNMHRLPDLIFMDINMPLMNGFECLLELKTNKHLHNIPVIIYSTSSTPSDVARAYNLGACLYLEKPFNINEFETIIKKLFSIPRKNYFFQPSLNTFIED